MPEIGGNTMSLPKFEGKNKPVPMDSLWTPYGVPMDFLWNNTVATPSPPALVPRSKGAQCLLPAAWLPGVPKTPSTDSGENSYSFSTPPPALSVVQQQPPCPDR